MLDERAGGELIPAVEQTGCREGFQTDLPGLLGEAEQLGQHSHRHKPFPPYVLAVLRVQLPERNRVGNDPVRQARVKTQLFRRFPDKHAARLQTELPEFRRALIQIHDHIASMPHRIERARCDSEAQHQVP